MSSSPKAPKGSEGDRGDRAAARQARIWLLIAVVATAAVLLYAFSVRPGASFGAAPHIPWWALAAIFYLVERCLVDMEFRRDAHSFSLSEIPLVLGLFFTSPAGLLLAQLVGLGAALLHRRLPLQKLVFNLSIAALGVGIATTLFRALVPSDGPFSFAYLGPAFIAMISVSVVEVLLISSAIYLSEGGLPRGARATSLLLGLVVTLTNTSLALMATTLLRFDSRATWLLLLPGVAIWLCYRAYSRQRQKSQRLESLSESTRDLHRKLKPESIVFELLSNARNMFRAETVELFLLPPTGDGSCLQAKLGPGAEFNFSRPQAVSHAATPWMSAVTKGRATLMPPVLNNKRWSQVFVPKRTQDAMSAPMFHEGRPIGGLLVTNGNGNRNPYKPDDLRLFKTLANHASIGFENVRLIDRLRVEVAEKSHLAMHDPLTGLPNRALFRERLGQAILAAAREGRNVAVILMDLDRFKDVNDTLGHQNGDLLLGEIARRLQTTLRKSDTAARLSGDEFAILLRSVSDEAASARAAEKLLGALNEPFAVQGVMLDVRASLGIALYPDHAQDANTLIQRADVAMYLAKGAHTGYEIYAAERDDYSRNRLALTGELRQAIERRQLDVHYQPKVDLSSGVITGVEALARWTHPVKGPIPPDQFIPLAEDAGQIRELTLYVLDRALMQCQEWQGEGLDLDVSVNLSVRNLQLQLLDDVAGLLDKHGVPAGKLILEITESIIMAHPLRAFEVVDKLSAMGVTLAIDDYGTGYSSLAYLARLPIKEIKVDKSFVMEMTDSSNAVIVRSTVDLGRNLGLRVVAEGVETQETCNALRELGCELAQGYYLSKPRSAPQLSNWLREQPSAPGPHKGASSRPQPTIRLSGDSAAFTT